MRGTPKSFAPWHPLSRRQASEGSSEDSAPKPRTLACFERRKPPLGAVFLVFGLRRALLGAGRGWNLAANHAIAGALPEAEPRALKVDKLATAGRQVRVTGARRPKLRLAQAGQTGVTAATRPLTAPSYGNGGHETVDSNR